MNTLIITLAVFSVMACWAVPFIWAFIWAVRWVREQRGFIAWVKELAVRLRAGGDDGYIEKDES